MREAKFKIGDRVKSVSNGTGEVKEALYSSLNDCWYYEVMECNTTLVCTLSEGDLEMAPEKKEYKMTVDIDIADNVVIASLFEKDGESLRPLAKGHGHLIHEGELGIAQAASYACKRLYESLGGTLTKGGSWR